MNTLLAAACLALAPSLAAHGEVDDVVIRTYELGDLLPTDVESSPVSLPLLPLHLAYHEVHHEPDVDEQEGPETLVEAALSMFYDFAVHDDSLPVDIWWLDDDTLTLRAPESAHTAYERLFDGIHAATHRDATVELATYRFDGVVPDGPIDADDGERIALRTVPLHVGRTHVLANETQHDYVRNWEPEIAQTIATSQPVTSRFSVGSTSLLRLEDVIGGGLRLRYALRTSELLGWDTRDAEIYARVSLDERIASEHVAGALDRPHVGVGTVWGEASLPSSGGTVWAVAQVDTDAGVVSYATRLRVLDVAPAPAPMVLGSGLAAWIVDASHVRWPSYARRHLRPAVFAPAADDDADAWHESMRLDFPSHRWGPIDDAINMIDELTYVDDAMPLTTIAFGSWLLILGEEQLIAEAAALTTVFGRETSAVDVELLVTRRETGAPAAETAARVLVTVDRRGTAGALAGHATTVLRAYEVDVAQNVSVASPIVTGILDGVGVTCRASGRGRVAVDLAVHLRHDDDELDLGGSGFRLLDRVGVFVAEWSGDVPTDGERHTARAFANDDGVVYTLHVTATPR